MRTLNLGILAHVDAGKTSLTERLLFEAGVLDEIGSVDAGSTQTDTLALERRRGITIKTAVPTFVLDVVDGVVPVVSALEILAGNDDRLLAEYVSAGTLSPQRLRGEIGAQTVQALVRPVFFGSAITGAGVAELMAGAIELLPVADSSDLNRASAEPPSATIFKIDRGPTGERVSYLRMRAGVLRMRDRVTLDGRSEAKVTAIRASAPGGFVRRGVLLAGEIGTVTGLGEARIDDVFGALPGDAERRASSWHFSPPTLETVVTPGPGSDGRALHTALSELAEADPLIGLRSKAPENSWCRCRCGHRLTAGDRARVDAAGIPDRSRSHRPADPLSAEPWVHDETPRQPLRGQPAVPSNSPLAIASAYLRMSGPGSKSMKRPSIRL